MSTGQLNWLECVEINLQLDLFACLHWATTGNIIHSARVSSIISSRCSTGAPPEYSVLRRCTTGSPLAIGFQCKIECGAW